MLSYRRSFSVGVEVISQVLQGFGLVNSNKLQGVAHISKP